MFTDIHNCCMLLGTADDILILCHKSPDGDTIGAAYGLYHALTQLGRRAAVRCSDPLPEKFAYIHGGIEMPEFEPQLIIAVDIAGPGLLGPALRDLGLQLIFSWQGAVVAATVVVFPLLYKSARAALEQVDPHLENAARTLGASELRILLTVSLPLAWKGIFAGLMLAFARGMGEFGATLMVAGNIPGKTQTLALAIYDAFQAGNDALATLLVLVTSGLCVTLLMAAEVLVKYKRRRRSA